MKLSKHFSLHEFECNCGCGFADPHPRLVRILEKVRKHFQRRIKVTSGCRCPEWNAHEGGSVRSQHLLGKAADIQVKGVSPEDVAVFVESMDEDIGGLGRYNSFTHIDVRDGKPWRGDKRNVGS